MTDTAQLYRKNKEAAKQILKEFPKNGTISAAKLKGRLQDDKRVTSRIKDAALAIDKTGEPLPKAYEWIADNYYLLDEKFRDLLPILRKFPHIQREEATVTPLPRYYMIFIRYLEYLERNAASFDDSAVEAFLAACFAYEAESPSIDDIYSFPILFGAAVINRIALVCASLTLDKNSQRKAAEKLSFYFAALHRLDSFRFEKSFAYSETERYLNADPAGFYPKMTERTKNTYRKQISLFAKKKKVSETEFAKEIYDKAAKSESERMRHVGAYLFCPKNKTVGICYSVLLAALTVGLIGFLCFYTLWSLLLIFPVWEAVKAVLDKLFAHFVKTEELPRLEIKQLPPSDGVLTVITTLLTGGKSDSEIFSRLEKAYLSNGMDNVFFGVLGDYGDHPHESAANDEKVFAFAVSRIEALNAKYGKHFYLFMRKRSFCKTQNSFIGYERKRGAVMELVRFLCGGEDVFLPSSASMECKCAENIRYVVTLDADTNLPPDAVKELAGIMLHPLNRPVIDAEKHRVSEGYGILQPRVGPELAAARKTAFSRVMCGVGGMEIYSFAAFDFYQSVFGNGNFCGKGILDKYAFDETVNQADYAFPEDSVLSHDILEGERLRTALVAEPTFTDGFPKNELSYFRRHHRWVRGDVQNLAFLGKTFRNGCQTVNNNFSALSKFKLFDNVRREAVPVFSFFGLLAASFLNENAASLMILFSLAFMLLPLVFDIGSLLCTWSFPCAARRFFSKGVTAGIWQSFLRFLLSLSALPKNAFVTLDAFFRSFWRMTVSRQNMLEWVTAAQSDSQSDNGILHYIQKNLAGAVIGVLLFVMSPYGILKLIGLMWFFFPAVACFTAKESVPETKKPTEKQSAVLRAYTADLWRMYESTVTQADRYLPPDNIQFEPQTVIARRSSPTNIGLYLASALSACDFDFISPKELYSRLDKTLNTIESLPKWRGHLYNWYDTQTGALLEPRYVSSVDTGNFLACLIVTAQGVKEYADKEPMLLDIAARLEKIYSKTDLKAVYNSQRELFALGVVFDEDGNASQTDYVFDMLMSEARTLSYIAAARRDVPKKHWSTLSRPLIKNGDRIGIASWTGTAFEYFMPSLFMPTVRGSLLYEALRFAFRAGRERTAVLPDSKRVWGISESGFYAFDEQNNYGYQAFGVPALGYKRGLEKDLVISPYSSFLALTLNLSLPLANLEKLKTYGAYGEFGFYEAVDFTPSRCTDGKGNIVKSSMAHHVGMSILAAANACFDDCMVRRFMSEPVMRSAAELLEEKIPVDAAICRVKFSRNEPERSKRPKFFPNSAGI